MTRQAVEALSPADVEAARWALYARALEPQIAKNYDVLIQERIDIDKPPSEATLRQRRAEDREILQQQKLAQGILRDVLELDEDDDEP